MIILRTHVFGPRERALMAALATVPSHRVAVAADETRGPLDVGRYDKVSITRTACRRLGLHRPADFTWRNGDYALYLARARFPREKSFWLIEADLEHSFPSYPALFAYFDQFPEYDLLTSYLNQPTAGWWWAQSARSHPTGVHRAMFCFIRLSARALDVCLQERQRGRRSPRDLVYWPNDEVFVATEVVAAGLRAADLNDLGAPTYTPDTLGFEAPINGDTLDLAAHPNMLFHPVLHGDAYRRRLDRLAAAWGTQADPALRIRRRLQRML